MYCMYSMYVCMCVCELHLPTKYEYILRTYCGGKVHFIPTFLK